MFSLVVVIACRKKNELTYRETEKERKREEVKKELMMDTNTNNKKKKRRIVIKVGTSSLIKADTGVIHLSQLAKICEQITELQKSSEFQCAIVTSGAVGAAWGA